MTQSGLTHQGFCLAHQRAWSSRSGITTMTGVSVGMGIAAMIQRGLLTRGSLFAILRCIGCHYPSRPNKRSLKEINNADEMDGKPNKKQTTRKRAKKSTA